MSTIRLMALLGCLLALGGCNVLPPFFGSSDLIVTNGDPPYATLEGKARLRANVSWDFVKSYEKVEWRRAEEVFDVEDVIARCEAFSPREVVDHEYATNGYVERVRYGTTRVIVCLDPLIVLETPRDQPKEVDVSDAMLDVHLGNPWMRVNVASLDLPDGYIAGTTVPYHKDVRWLSPTLNQEATRVEGGDSRRVIDVPGGSLELRKRGRSWRVLACPD